MSILLGSTVSAVSIGISPGRANFKNVLRDGYAERTVRISTSTSETVLAEAQVKGDIEDWVRFSNNETQFLFSRNEPYQLTIIVEPPEDIPSGNYTGFIEFITQSVGGVEGRAGALVKTAIDMIIDIEVGGEEVIDCRVGGFSLNDIEVDFPLEVQYVMFNDGNIRLDPTLNVEVYDLYEENVVYETEVIGDTVLPTTQERIISDVPLDLDVGQYWVNLRVNECNVGTKRTFTIVEKGGIIDRGHLLDIVHESVVYTDETVQFAAKFQNDGVRQVDAVFNGVIRRDGSIVEIIETDTVVVAPGEIADLIFFFTPPEPGRYTIDGRVSYNKKLTFEKGTILNVSPAPDREDVVGPSYIPLLIYLLIIITIIFILRRIIKEEKKKKQRRRRRRVF